MCGSCSISQFDIYHTQTIATTDNKVQVEDVPTTYTVFYDGTLSGATSHSIVSDNHISIKNAINSSIVPFRVSSSQATALVSNNIFDLNNAGANVRGYLVSGPSDGGSSTDAVCIVGNLITTSSSDTAATLPSLPTCNTTIVHNTIRAYGGSGLGSWSLLGSKGARGKFLLDSNTIDSEIDFNSVISDVDLDTGLPSYTGGDADFVLTNNNFPGKNVSVGLGGTNNKLTLDGGALNYVVLSGPSTGTSSTSTLVVEESIETT